MYIDDTRTEAWQSEFTGMHSTAFWDTPLLDLNYKMTLLGKSHQGYLLHKYLLFKSHYSTN